MATRRSEASRTSTVHSCWLRPRCTGGARTLSVPSRVARRKLVWLDTPTTLPRSPNHTAPPRLAAVSIAASSTYSSSVTQRLAVGDSLSVAGWSATLEGVRSVPSARRDSVVADLRLRRDGRDVGVYQPALSTYPNLAQAVGTPSVRTTWTEDAYLVLVEIDEAQSFATVRLAVNPLVLWLWLSVGVMILGSAVAGWPRRRTKASARAVAPPVPAFDTPAPDKVGAGV